MHCWSLVPTSFSTSRRARLVPAAVAGTVWLILNTPRQKPLLSKFSNYDRLTLGNRNNRPRLVTPTRIKRLPTPLSHAFPLVPFLFSVSFPFISFPFWLYFWIWIQAEYKLHCRDSFHFFLLIRHFSQSRGMFFPLIYIWSERKLFQLGRKIILRRRKLNVHLKRKNGWLLQCLRNKMTFHSH